MLESNFKRPRDGAEKWREIWRICEAARQLSPVERPQFFAAQQLDPDMERDVISLLMEPADSVTPSWGTPADSSFGLTPAPVTMSLTGVRVGRYMVGNLLGRGGGGVVYSARDNDLDRTVALKFLHPGRIEARWTVERLLREAKAASALNHPSVITVHEVIQSEAGLAIAMELVEGRPLRHFCRGANSPASVARWGAQIADALAAAHARGIIHRDIKPENLMLREDGYIKVLDFGLAQNDGGLEDRAGAFLPAGTPRYMSPEQATGGKLTTATDIFSLGIVLYELTAGRHPFPADTALSSLEAIALALPARLPREVPGALETLILRMLEKDPQRRPGAAEVARLLDVQRSPAGVWRPGRPAAAVGILAAALMGYWAWQRQPRPGPVAASPIPLTNTLGVDSHPDIGPDGESVVYGWGKEENSYTHLYIKRLDRDEPVKLLEVTDGERISNPRWSPDGQRILFKSSAPGLQYALWSIAQDGTDRRKVWDLRATDHSSGLDWAPDGRRIAYTDRILAQGNRYAVLVRDLATGRNLTLTSPPEGTWGDWDPRFSPDGDTIAFKRVTGLSNDQILTVPSTGGVPTPITPGRQGIAGHAWLDNGRLLVAGRFQSSVYGLFSVEARTGAVPQLVHRSGLDEIRPAVRGNRAAWVNRLDDHNIYAVPLAGGTPARWIASATYDGKPAVSVNGDIAFISRRSGDTELWVSGPKGVNPVRVTSLKSELSRPAWSADGKQLSFSIESEGKVYRSSCHGTPLRCEAPQPWAAGVNPHWSGAAVFFTAANDGIYRLLPGGTPTFTNQHGRDPLPSPDGRWLYYREVAKGLHLARIPLDAEGRRAGLEEMLIDRTKSSNREHWTVAGNEVIYWDNDTDSSFTGLRAFHTVTRKSRVIAEGPAMYPAVSPDGLTILFSRRDKSGVNVMVADLGR